MKAKFEVIFLEEAREFLISLDPKVRRKIIFNVDRARHLLDSSLFKKLDEDIWEFRTRYDTCQYRMLAFWDRKNGKDTFVIATHGFIKKQNKVPLREIKKAIRLKKYYRYQ